MENESKLRILLIEDAAPEQRAFQSYAQSQPDVEGIWCADCVEEGLRLLREQTPNFVVLDWMLKGEGGDRFLERIRELEGSRPCIFVASNITSEYTKAKAGNTGLIENYYEKTAAGYGPAYLLQEMRRYNGTLFDRTKAVIRANPCSPRPSEEEGPLSDEELRKQIRSILRRCGLNTNTISFISSVETMFRAVRLYQEKGPNYAVTLEKDIYPQAGAAIWGNNRQKNLIVEEKRRESAIRRNLQTIIQMLYDREADKQLLELYFVNRNAMGVNGGYPPVKLFLLNFAETFASASRKDPNRGK